LTLFAWKLQVWVPHHSTNLINSYPDFFSNESATRIERGQTSLGIAKSWLNACSTGHTLCNIRNTERFPTRLLDVKEDPVRLVLTNGWDIKPHYATLSHCWGTLNFLKLTQNSLESFMASIPAEELTRTFTDAISITRELGIDYLWIDSLCIIQDSSEDWEKESALMCSIYSGSKINIAAAAAHDGTEGCFCQSPGYTKSVHVEDAVDGQKLGFTFVQQDLYLKSLLTTHLASRAWALQVSQLLTFHYLINLVHLKRCCRFLINYE
jgi:hypothetical protein